MCVCVCVCVSLRLSAGHVCVCVCVCLPLPKFIYTNCGYRIGGGNHEVSTGVKKGHWQLMHPN